MNVLLDGVIHSVKPSWSHATMTYGLTTCDEWFTRDPRHVRSGTPPAGVTRRVVDCMACLAAEAR